eukprot:7268081-Prymnesium_polylepis.1
MAVLAVEEINEDVSRSREASFAPPSSRPSIAAAGGDMVRSTALSLGDASTSGAGALDARKCAGSAKDTSPDSVEVSVALLHGLERSDGALG